MNDEDKTQNIKKQKASSVGKSGIQSDKRFYCVFTNDVYSYMRGTTYICIY